MPEREASPVLPGALALRPKLTLGERLRGKRLGMPW